MSIYGRISREVDVKLEGDSSGNIGALSDAAFPPLPGPGTRPRGRLTKEDNPTLVNKSEALRAQLLETWPAKQWTLVQPITAERRKTTTTASAVPKAQFPGPQQPHPPPAVDILEEVKEKIATADTPEAVDTAGIALGQVYKTDEGPSNMPPMPPPEPAAMDVDSGSGPIDVTTDAALLLTKK